MYGARERNIFLLLLVLCEEVHSEKLVISVFTVLSVDILYIPIAKSCLSGSFVTEGCNLDIAVTIPFRFRGLLKPFNWVNSISRALVCCINPSLVLLTFQVFSKPHLLLCFISDNAL